MGFFKIKNYCGSRRNTTRKWKDNPPNGRLQIILFANHISDKGHVCVLNAQSGPTLCDPMERLLCPWDSPGKNTRVGCHVLLQGIFLTQRSNPGILHCRQILYCLNLRDIYSYNLKNSYCGNGYTCMQIY